MNPTSPIVLFTSFPQNLNNAPAFTRRERTGFDNPNLVAGRNPLDFIMGHELRPLSNISLVNRVLHQTIDAHHYRFHHLVAGYYADLLDAPATGRRRRFNRGSGHRRALARRRFLIVDCFIHSLSLRAPPRALIGRRRNYFSMPSVRPRKIVFNRASSFF